MERILALSNRAASSARALRLMLASMGIEVNGRGTDIYIYIHTHDTTYARHAFNHQGQRRWKIQVVRGREGRWNPLATVTYVVLKCQLAAAQTLPDTLSYRRRMIIGEIDSAIPPFRPPFRFPLIPHSSEEQPCGSTGWWLLERGGKIFLSTTSWQEEGSQWGMTIGINRGGEWILECLRPICLSTYIDYLYKLR